MDSTFFKETLNSSFDYFSQKVKGRFAAFAIQLILSYLAVAIFTLILTVVVISLINQGDFSLDLFSVIGIFQWFEMIDPVWSVTVVVAANYLFRTNITNGKMSFPDFYIKRSPQFWLDLLIAVCLLSIVLIIYNKSDLIYSYGNATPLDLLLAEGSENIEDLIQVWLSNWLFYIVEWLPIAVIVFIEIRERKRHGQKLRIPIWKITLGTILMVISMLWVFENFIYIFNQLITTLICAPFEMIEIPTILSILTSIVIITFSFIIYSAFVHFGIQYGMEENPDQLMESTI